MIYIAAHKVFQLQRISKNLCERGNIKIDNKNLKSVYTFSLLITPPPSLSLSLSLSLLYELYIVCINDLYPEHVHTYELAI